MTDSLIGFKAKVLTLVVLKETAKLQTLSEFTILAGDWNLALNHEVDTFGYKGEHNINAKKVLIDGMNDLCLVDIFREKHPDMRRFSWRKFGDTKRARLDFHLISAQLVPFVQKSDIQPGLCSDHSIGEL